MFIQGFDNSFHEIFTDTLTKLAWIGRPEQRMMEKGQLLELGALQGPALLWHTPLACLVLLIKIQVTAANIHGLPYTHEAMGRPVQCCPRVGKKRCFAGSPSPIQQTEGKWGRREERAPAPWWLEGGWWWYLMSILSYDI